MAPTLSPADRVIVSSIAYGPRVPFSAARLPGLQAPRRGDLVVVQPPFFSNPTIIARIFEPLVSFFTLQKGTLHRDIYNTRVNGLMVKRLIGLPGDTLRLAGYQVSIRAAGASDFVPEQQLIGVSYTLSTRNAAPGLSATTPFAGEGPETVLKANEYYVLGDDRPDSSDSRSWGPVTGDRLLGKVIYRYWPPGSLGKI
jgi:signal peptidase I